MIGKIKKFDSLFFLGVTVISVGIMSFTQAFFPYAISSNLFKLNGGNAGSDVVIVAIDDKTLNSGNFKRYQDISRCDYSTLLRNVLNAEPRAVGVDVFFSQKSNQESCDAELSGLLKKNDNVVIGTEYDESSQRTLPSFGNEIVENVGLVNTNGYSPSSNFLSYLGINGESDTKNSILLYGKGEGVNVLPLSMAVYKKAYGVNNVDVTESSVEFAGMRTFDHDEGRFFINFFAKEYPTVSFIDAINGTVPEDFFKNKVVFVGATAKDIHDEFYTPYDNSNFMPGVVIHANAYDTLAKNAQLSYLSFGTQALLGILFTLAVAYVLISNSGVAIAIVSMGAILLTTVSFIVLAFVTSGRFVESTPFVVGAVFIGFASYVHKFMKERKSKEEIRHMFSKYVSEDVANELISKGVENLGIGGTERDVSVFFSDIAGFTDLSEKLTPNELSEILNAYFEKMSSIILSERGTIDKFIGDAIMAFWNAPTDQPNHADLACSAAIRQRMAMESVRDEIKALGYDAKVDMRIGINSGKAVIGNFGCAKRYEYTAIGDTVNLASRLESISKQYGTNLIVGEIVISRITEGKFSFREIDLITVKGKNEPVRIFELQGFANDPKSESWKTLNESFSKGVVAYRERRFEDAKEIFESLQHDPVSVIYSERCVEFIKNKPGKDWDGVYRFKTK